MFYVLHIKVIEVKKFDFDYKSDAKSGEDLWLTLCMSLIVHSLSNLLLGQKLLSEMIKSAGIPARIIINVFRENIT